MRSAALRNPHPDHRPMTWREPIKVQAMRLSGASNVVALDAVRTARKVRKAATGTEEYAKAIRRQRGQRLKELYPELWSALCWMPLAKAAIRMAETRERAVWELESVERQLMKHAEDLVSE